MSSQNSGERRVSPQPIPERTKFAAAFGEIKLPEEIKQRIANEVEEVVMRNIANLDLGGGKGGNGDVYVKLIRNPEWYGIWIRRFLDMRDRSVEDIINSKVDEKFELQM